MKTPLKLVLLALAVAAVSRADEKKAQGKVVSLASVEWKDAPAPVPPGVKVAPLASDPTNKGGIAYAKFPPGFDFPAHTHSFNEYSTVLAGKPAFTLDGKTTELAPGDFILIPAHEVHSLHCGGDAECVVITVRGGPTDYHFVDKK